MMVYSCVTSALFLRRERLWKLLITSQGTQLRRQQLSEPPFPQFSFLPVWIPSFPVSHRLLCCTACLLPSQRESYAVPAPALSSSRLHVQRPALSVAPATLSPAGEEWDEYRSCILTGRRKTICICIPVGNRLVRKVLWNGLSLEALRRLMLAARQTSQAEMVWLRKWLRGVSRCLWR